MHYLYTQIVFTLLLVYHFPFVTPSLDCKHDGIAKSFINTIFQKYSNITANNTENITVKDFEKLMNNLFLGVVYVKCDENDASCHENKLMQVHLNGRKETAVDTFYKIERSRERRSIGHKPTEDSIDLADHWKEHIDKVFLLKHFSSCSILSEAVRINYYMCIEMLCIQYTIYHQIIMKLGISGGGGSLLPKIRAVMKEEVNGCFDLLTTTTYGFQAILKIISRFMIC